MPLAKNVIRAIAIRNAVAKRKAASGETAPKVKGKVAKKG